MLEDIFWIVVVFVSTFLVILSLIKLLEILA